MLHNNAKLVSVHAGGEVLRLSALCLPARFATSHRRFLLLHGNPSDMDHYVANVDFLREYGDVALFDTPGFGRSQAPRGPLSLDFLADVAKAYMETLGWTAAVDLVGHSHGGAVAVTMAARHPEYVRRLVLLATVGCPAHLSMRLMMLPGATAVANAVGRPHGIAFNRLARAFTSFLAARSFAPDLIPAGFVDRELRLVLQTPEILLSCVRANDGDPTSQLRRQASLVRSPILMIHGRGDQLIPIDYARRLFDLMDRRSPDSRFEAIDGGHMVHLSRPWLVHRLLEPWLD